MVYTYLIGDNFLYRAAVYLFTGLTAGFVVVVTYDSAIRPWLNALQTGGIGSYVLGLLPLLIALVLLPPVYGLRVILPPLRRIALAFLIGVGAAVALVGAISGTIIPLALQSGQSVGDGWLVGTITLLGVITTLVYFQYSARRHADGTTHSGIITRTLSAIGGIFIAITLGTIYAAAVATTLTVFSERVGFLLTQIFGG